MKWLSLFTFLPITVYCQDITGLWTGTLYNDTTQKSLQYEVAITRFNGKLTGYSHTTFILDDKEYVGVKSLKVTKERDRYFLEDEDLLYNNYPVAPPKGVKQLCSLTYTESADSTKVLSGKFITSRTRQFGRQVTGTVRLERKKEPANSKLITALFSLRLSHTLSFLPPTHADVPVTSAQKASASASVVLPMPTPPSILDELTKRKVETIETVSFTADSLTLTLYDNGEVDGDTVSVIVNGKVVLQHQRLSTQPITKTIQTPSGITDSVKIIMYAENLGSIPPNTGLLIIHDGAMRHEITFSGDLQKNSSIVMKRKKL